MPIACFAMICTACSNNDTSKAKAQPAQHPTVKNTSKPAQPVKKTDGTIISMKPIKISGTDSLLKTYRMMYWSQGLKVEAYVAAPNEPGRSFQLYLSLHGGYETPLHQKHVVAMADNDDLHVSLLGKNILQGASISVITVTPMYQGYGDSDGTVHGLNSDTIDTQNAIKAVKSYFQPNKNRPVIEGGLISLYGISLGGGVALKVASERSDIVGVIAISPFIGWDITGEFYKEHQNNSTWKNKLSYGVKFYGPFDPKRASYQQQSIDYKKISAPVLLIQGTKDPTVPWQTAQTFYQKMKADGQNVTFKLVKGGNHGLSNKTTQKNALINDWLKNP